MMRVRDSTQFAGEVDGERPRSLYGGQREVYNRLAPSVRRCCPFLPLDFRASDLADAPASARRLRIDVIRGQGVPAATAAGGPPARPGGRVVCAGCP